MSFLSLLPKIKLSFAIVLLGLIGFANAPVVKANTVDVPAAVSAVNTDASCMHHLGTNTKDRTHICCDQGSDQPCPDDMDCDRTCNTVCTSAVFLTPAFMPSPNIARNAVYLSNGTPLFAFQVTLNAPPPRS